MFGILLLVVAVLLAGGCGSDSNGSPTTIYGIAAAGAPIAAGELYLIDSGGTRRSVPIDDDGSYQIDVSGLAGPYLIQVVGMVGGRPAVLHSIALPQELGNINVTPLTEILSALVLRQDLQDLFNEPRPNLSSVTAQSLQSGELQVAGKLAPLFNYYGVVGTNIRTTPFTASGAGMDGLLDATNIVAVQDPNTRELRYELRIVTRDTPLIVNPFDFASGGAVPFDSGDEVALSGLVSTMPQINARLQELEGLFASAIPSKQAVAPYFAQGFMHNGLDLDAHLDKVLLKDAYLGHQVSRAAIEKIVDANTIQISYAVSFVTPSFPQPEFVTMKRVGGQWLIWGNQELAAASVSYMARVFSKRLTEAELSARSDVVKQQEYDSYVGANRAAYYLEVADSSATDGYHLARIGFPEDENFGVLASAGATYDDPATTDLDERDIARRFSRFIGTASARVRAYLIFGISTPAHPDVHHVVVTGPGIPTEGLILVRPRDTVPRDTFILKDDYMDWNSFNTERCQNFDAPDGCALDWNRVVTGSTYTYSFRNAADSVIGSTARRLMGRPLTEEGWFAKKDRFFPQFTLTGEQELNLANVLDTTPGAHMTGNGTATVNWILPTDPIVKMENILVWRNYQIGNQWGADFERKEDHRQSLIGSTATSQTIKYEDVDFLTTWAWATVVARDVYGNHLDHEVSPQNPYGIRCVPTAEQPICEGAGYTLPPKVKAARKYPKLANYFHMMHYGEAQVPDREDYLAQWDVIVLNPQFVKDAGVSLARIRAVNPNIKILAWVPSGQSSLDFEMSTGMPGLPLDQGGEYFLKDTDGNLMQWWWGGYFMNPYKDEFAFPKRVISYLEAHYLVPGMYDGIMFDCLWYNAPHWFSPTGQTEVNEDTSDNGGWFWDDDDYASFWVNQDSLDYRAGFTYLLETLGSAGHRPNAILTGNGIDQYNADHLHNANGNLVESAYGDEFGSNWPNWSTQWDVYQKSMKRLGRSPQYVMVNADVRHGRTDPEAREVPGMTVEDKRRFRLSLTTTLLGDGYFAFDRGDGNHAQLWWFDEYDIDLGNPASGYAAPNSYRTDLYAAGTYNREFANGTVIVNPTTGPVSVTFTTDHTDVSTATRGRTFTIPASDGRIYMKN